MRVPLTNEKERQTYYGARSLATKDFHVCSFPKGDRANIVAFVKHLHALYPRAKLLVISDGASYHRYADMQTYLHMLHQGGQEKKIGW